MRIVLKINNLLSQFKKFSKEAKNKLKRIKIPKVKHYKYG